MLQTLMEIRPFTRLLIQADWYIHIQPPHCCIQDVQADPNFIIKDHFINNYLLSTLNQILLFCHIICSQKYFLTKNSLVYLNKFVSDFICFAKICVLEPFYLERKVLRMIVGLRILTILRSCMCLAGCCSQ